MIGTQNDAEAALNRAMTLYSWDGSARLVYRNYDQNIVYKVDREIGANEAEWANYVEMSYENLPDGIAIPQMSRYEIADECILAAEYISGEPTGECMDSMLDLPCECAGKCLSANEEEMIRPYITDLAWGNVIRSNGILYLVDIEC